MKCVYVVLFYKTGITRERKKKNHSYQLTIMRRAFVVNSVDANNIHLFFIDQVCEIKKNNFVFFFL